MPISQPTAPPRRATKTSPGTAKPAASPSFVASPLYGKSKDRAEGLQGWMQLATLGCIARGWTADAGAIAQHGEKVSTEIARTAESAEPLGKVLDWLSMSGPYAALFGAVLPFTAQILMNHGVIPDTIPLEGVVPPAMLEAQVTAEIATMKIVAIQAQKEAEARLSEAQALMNGGSEKVAQNA